MEVTRLRWVQVLRALAALMVAVFHFFALYNYNASKTGIDDFNSTLYPVASVLIGKGFFGVDLFFVISGFIMFYALKSYSTKEFLINRFTRIYPVFFVSMIAFAILKLHYFLGMPIIFILELFFIPLGGPAPPLTVGYNLVIWTLNYEMYFYLMMGLSLIFHKHWYKALNIYFFLTLLVLPFLVFKKITLASTGYDFDFVGLRFITNPLIINFWIGLLIGYLFSYKKFTVNIKVFNLLTILILTAFVIYFTVGPRTLPLWGLTGIGAFAPLIVLIFAYDDLNRVIKFEPPSWLVKLGDMSYSLYLWHPFVLEFTYKYFYSDVPKFIIPPGSSDPILAFYRGTPSLWFLPVYLAITLLLSAGSYYLFELKATKKLRKFLKAKFVKGENNGQSS